MMPTMPQGGMPTLPNPQGAAPGRGSGGPINYSAGREKDGEFDWKKLIMGILNGVGGAGGSFGGGGGIPGMLGGGMMGASQPILESIGFGDDRNKGEEEGPHQYW